MKKIILPLGFILTLCTGNVWASPYTSSFGSDSYDSTPNGIPTPNQYQDESNDIYNAFNALLGTSYTSNDQVDAYQYTGNDNVWTTGSSNAPFALIGIGGMAAESLRVYDVDNAGYKINPFGAGTTFSGLTITGDGSLSNPFPAAISPLAAGTTFDWSMNSFITTNMEWDSDPSKNYDGMDHMLTYQLTDLRNQTVYLDYYNGQGPVEYKFQDPYLIAFEDLALRDGTLGDEDYNDLIFVVDRVAPVAAPEPFSTALFLTGGLLMGGNLLRRRKFATV